MPTCHTPKSFSNLRPRKHVLPRAPGQRPAAPSRSSDELLAALTGGAWDGEKVQVVVCPVLLHVPRVAKALAKQRRIQAPPAELLHSFEKRF